MIYKKTPGIVPGRSKGKKIKGFVDGRTVSFRLHKVTPRKCSEPRRICIVCLKTAIHKNDNNYDSKICKVCTSNLPR